MIEIECPHCHTLLQIADDQAGLRSTCMDCGGIIRVPVAEMRQPETAVEEGALPPVPAQILEKHRKAVKHRIFLGVAFVLVFGVLIALFSLFFFHVDKDTPPPSTPETEAAKYDPHIKFTRGR